MSGALGDHERWLLRIGAELLASRSESGRVYGPGDVIVVGSATDLGELLDFTPHDDAPVAIAILRADVLAARFRAFGANHPCPNPSTCTARERCERIAAGVQQRAGEVQVGIVSGKTTFFAGASTVAAELERATALAMGFSARGGDA